MAALNSVMPGHRLAQLIQIGDSDFLRHTVQVYSAHGVSGMSRSAIGTARVDLRTSAG